MQEPKSANDRLDLIALKRADKMPLRAGGSGQNLHFGHRLLNSILTKDPAAADHCFPEPLNAHCLCRGNQSDLDRIAARRASRTFDAFSNLLQPVRDSLLLRHLL